MMKIPTQEEAKPCATEGKHFKNRFSCVRLLLQNVFQPINEEIIRFLPCPWLEVKDAHSQKTVVDLVRITQFFLMQGPIDLIAKIEHKEMWIVRPTAGGCNKKRKRLIRISLRELSEQSGFSNSFSSFNYQQLCITVKGSINSLKNILSLNLR